MIRQYTEIRWNGKLTKCPNPLDMRNFHHPNPVSPPVGRHHLGQRRLILLVYHRALQCYSLRLFAGVETPDFQALPSSGVVTSPKELQELPGEFFGP